MAPVIVAKDLYKCYPGFAPVLRGVNIEVQPGETVAIMGPSGCGKSTMLHILGMLHAPDSGELSILGTDILKLDREQTAAFRRGNMGFVMQSNNLFEHSTVFENVEFPLIYDNVPPQERWSRVIRALELVRLSARVHYRSNRLSGGEQQRVAIARAMVNNPRILLADEPTGALDAHTSKLIMENFRQLCHSGGVSMVMVTHDPKMAEYCDSIYTLEEGVLHCKKHEVVPFVPDGKENLLNPVTPVIRGALTARRFPEPLDPDLMELARNLNSIKMLSRIYSISGSGLLGNPEGYALSLPVRHLGLWQKIMAPLTFFRRARGSGSLWSLWRHLPGSSGLRHNLLGNLRAFASGTIVARWGLGDDIQFLFASGARRAATAAWVAGRLLRLPFAFSARGRDIAHYGSDWPGKCGDAAFIICPTNAIREAMQKLLPGLPPEKLVLQRNPLVAAPAEDEGENFLPPQPNKPLEILAMGPWTSRVGFAALLEACAILKRLRLNFKLSVLGPRSWRQRWGAWRRGLGKNIAFMGRPDADAMRVIFKNADIFVAWPPQGRGEDLELPWYLCEAMAFGLPILLLALCPGFAEALRPGGNCQLAQSVNAAGLAEGLRGLAANDALRRQLGDQARQDIRRLLDAEANPARLADLMVAAAAGTQGRRAEK